MTDTSRWKQVIGAVAPALARALGGPLAGTAVQVIADKVLGKPNATEQEISQAVLSLPPEALVKLKEAELAFQKHLADSGVKLEEIHQHDRDSARQREIAIKDMVPGTLAALVVCGFGWVVWTLLTTEPPSGNKEVLYMMLGALSAALSQVLAYYFGSSSGSKEKTGALERIANR